MPRSGYCPAYEARCAGLVLCGGGDLAPWLFGQESCGARDIDPERDQAELALTAAFFQAGKPILAICRGHQVVNVVLGGDLIQELQPHQQALHTCTAEEPGDKAHPIRTAEGCRLRALLGPAPLVNSSHHQAVGRLGSGLVASGWSEDGLVEAMEHTALPLLSVQFHPERMCGGFSRSGLADGLALFHWLLRGCRSPSKFF